MQIPIEGTGFRYRYLLHAKQALYHLSYAHWYNEIAHKKTNIVPTALNILVLSHVLECLQLCGAII